MRRWIVVLGMQGNDTDAEFTEFVSAHSGSLRHTAYLLTGSRQVAEDLLQDALVKTWLSWSKVNPRTAWAYTRTVMVNLTTDRWRRKRYEAVTMDIDDRRADRSNCAANCARPSPAWASDPTS